MHRGDRPRNERRPLSRRDFLRVSSGAVAGAAGVQALGAAGTANAQAPAAAEGGYPVVDVAALADLAPGATVPFSYPDESSPALLLRLDGPALDGTGDDGSLVAFSVLCTHKGCPVSYRAEHGMLICPCHWSTFDPAKGGSLVIGQASERLPRIELRLRDGIVQAVGVDGLIYGRHTNIL